MNYDVDYFINKFENIEASHWCTNSWHKLGSYCANGHCGVTSADTKTAESLALKNIFNSLYITDYAGDIINETPGGFSRIATYVNDGDAVQYQQPTPKQRILAALYDIKKMQTKDTDTGGKEEKKERIVYVSVPVSITEQSKELVMS